MGASSLTTDRRDDLPKAARWDEPSQDLFLQQEDRSDTGDILSGTALESISSDVAILSGSDSSLSDQGRNGKFLHSGSFDIRGILDETKGWSNSASRESFSDPAEFSPAFSTGGGYQDPRHLNQHSGHLE